MRPASLTAQRLRVRFVSADVAADVSMLVFALMAICFVLQKLGKKINPIVLAWHIQQWLAHAGKSVKKPSTTNDDSGSTPDDGSVRTAPNSGQGSKVPKDSASSSSRGAGGSSKSKTGSGGSTSSKGSSVRTAQRCHCGFILRSSALTTVLA